jgi:hypothetical protein
MPRQRRGRAAPTESGPTCSRVLAGNGSQSSEKVFDEQREIPIRARVRDQVGALAQGGFARRLDAPPRSVSARCEPGAHSYAATMRRTAVAPSFRASAAAMAGRAASASGPR